MFILFKWTQGTTSWCFKLLVGVYLKERLPPCVKMKSAYLQKLNSVTPCFIPWTSWILGPILSPQFIQFILQTYEVTYEMKPKKDIFVNCKAIKCFGSAEILTLRIFAVVHFHADVFLIVFNMHSVKLKIKRSYIKVCLLYFMSEQVA